MWEGLQSILTYIHAYEPCMKGDPKTRLSLFKIRAFYYCTIPETKIASEKMVGRLLSFWDIIFSRAMNKITDFNVGAGFELFPLAPFPMSERSCLV